MQNREERARKFVALSRGDPMVLGRGMVKAMDSTAVLNVAVQRLLELHPELQQEFWQIVKVTLLAYQLPEDLFDEVDS